MHSIIPKIYNILLRKSNKKDKLQNPENHFYIHGLDFIVDENNKLVFLEINSPPGHVGGPLGIYNYQDFMYKATNFILR